MTNDYEIADFLIEKEDVIDMMKQQLTHEEIVEIQVEGAEKKGREEGREETIVQCINNLLKQHQTKDYVIQTLVSLFTLDRDEALEYYEKALEFYDAE